MFDHFRTYSPKSRLSEARKVLIRARLRDTYTVDDLKLAIDGLFLSKWHVDNGNLTIEYAIRNSDKIERCQAVATDKRHSDRVDGPILTDSSRDAIRAMENFNRRHAND